jgi:hypothetical protein
MRKLYFGLIIIVLFFIVFYVNKGCNNKTTETIKTEFHTHVDTIWKHDTAKIESKPKIQSQSIIDRSTVNIDDYNSLLVQYNSLLDSFYTLKNYIDTIVKDSSKIYVKNKVWQNSIVSSVYDWDIKYPTITITNDVIHTEIVKNRQLYFGAGFLSNLEINIPNIGFLYKNRKDNIIGIKAGTDIKGSIYGELSIYTKIKLW